MTKKRVEKMIEKTQTREFVIWKDKISFTLGVLLIIFTFLIIGRFPLLLPMWFSIWTIFVRINFTYHKLLFLRYLFFHSQSWHYFMIDFCYLGNLLALFNFYVYPTSGKLFLLNYTNSLGPIAWAIVLWRNSLVFHDIEKLTSFLIHAFPPLVVYVIRWFPEFQNSEITTCIDKSCYASFYDVVFPHMMFYFFWQFSYYLKTEVVDYEKFQKNKELLTSFRWMQNDKKGLIYPILQNVHPNLQVFVFMSFQCLFHFLTAIPVYFMYNYQIVNLIILSYVLTVGLWNGANFYIDVFAKKYQNNLLRFSKESKEKKEED